MLLCVLIGQTCISTVAFADTFTRSNRRSSVSTSWKDGLDIVAQHSERPHTLALMRKIDRPCEFGPKRKERDRSRLGRMDRSRRTIDMETNCQSRVESILATHSNEYGSVYSINNTVSFHYSQTIIDAHIYMNRHAIQAVLTGVSIYVVTLVSKRWRKPGSALLHAALFSEHQPVSPLGSAGINVRLEQGGRFLGRRRYEIRQEFHWRKCASRPACTHRGPADRCALSFRRNSAPRGGQYGNNEHQMRRLEGLSRY